MGIIKRLLGGDKRIEPAEEPVSQTPSIPTLPEVDPQASTRRELLRMLLRDSLRFSGVPESWIEPQYLLEPGRNGQTNLHLRLVVRHWDERLLQYAVAFQRRLRAEVQRFEPGAKEWLLTISWQYEVDDQCPYQLMPEPSTWTASDNAASVASKEEADVQADLARLFAVRDAHLGEAFSDSQLPVGNAPPERPRSGQSAGIQSRQKP